MASELSLGPLLRDRLKVCDALKEQGSGSFLRGWRLELDPTGSLEVNFLNFCMAAQRLRLAVDSSLLFGEDSPNEMTLDELAPDVGALVDRFRSWMTRTFGGPGEMFSVLEPHDSIFTEGRLSRAEFLSGVLGQGFEATEAEVSEIFSLLDPKCCNSVAMEDVIFLDLDPKTRGGAIQKAKAKPRVEHEQLLTSLHRDIQGTGYRDGHRLAPRGWHAPDIDRLPQVVIERRHAHKDRLHCRKSEVWALFLRHITNKYGNGVRAWRKGLDPNACFRLTRKQFLRHFRVVNVDFDSQLLWSVMDRDFDGILRLEEVAPQSGAALARFWKFVTDRSGSCAASWLPIMKAARPPSSWKSTTSLKYATFVAAIKELGWTPGMEGGESKLCQALDRDGCGIICNSDIDWLGKWTPPEWLFAEPDKEAWLELSALLLRKYERPLAAWRQLDQDDSNNASWDEFKEVCNMVEFSGDRGGAWRYLDRTIQGNITLRQWDYESAEVLGSFKDFLDENYGSVKFAFERIDTDNSGSVTLSELRRACHRRGWKGDVNMIFKCMNLSVLPGVRSLCYKDIAFLDSWEPQLDENILESRGMKLAGSTDRLTESQQLKQPQQLKLVRPQLQHRSAPVLPASTTSPADLALPRPQPQRGGGPRRGTRPTGGGAVAGPACGGLAAALVSSAESGVLLKSSRTLPALPMLSPTPPRTPALVDTRPSLSRASCVRPASRSIATPTLEELVSDVERRRQARLATAKALAAKAAPQKRRAGVGCLRSETVRHMRRELERLRGAQETILQEHNEYRKRSAEQRRAAPPALETTWLPQGGAEERNDDDDNDLALEDSVEGAPWLQAAAAKCDLKLLTDC